MNQKMVLSTGIEFSLTAVFNNTENQLTIALTDIESYDAARAEFTPEAMQEVRHYVNENTYTPYEAYTSYVKTDQVNELIDGTKEVVFVFGKPSEQEIQSLEIAVLREQLSLVQDAFNELILRGSAL